MADLGFDFNVEDVPADEFERLPPGRYLVQVIDSKVSDDENAEGGKIAIFDMVVIQGDLEGRHWFEWVRYFNPNETVQRIGQQTLAKIFSVCGHKGARATEVVHDIPFYIDVDDRFSKKQQKSYRQIIGYEAYSPTASAPPRAPAAQAAQRPAGYARPQQGGGAANQGGTVAARAPGNWRNRAGGSSGYAAHQDDGRIRADGRVLPTTSMDDEIPF